jgi:hypothetical protein
VTRCKIRSRTQKLRKALENSESRANLPSLKMSLIERLKEVRRLTS